MTPNASYPETYEKNETKKKNIFERYEVIKNLRPYHADNSLSFERRMNRI